MRPDDAPLPPPGARPARVLRWRGGARQATDDWLSEEVPVALEYNGIAHAVMLATPTDLEDFALGFSLSEGLIDSPADLLDCEEEAGESGITLHLTIASRCFVRLKARRRSMTGRTGCGLCGTEQLDQVRRALPTLPAPSVGRVFAAEAIAGAARRLRQAQALNQVTGSAHAAAWCDAQGRIVLLREDVGRHNALDKLAGAMARVQADPRQGFIVVTSRASLEMVQKAVVAGVGLLAAVSAPTQMAVDTSASAGLALVGLVRGDDLVVYTGGESIMLGDEPAASSEPPSHGET